MKGDFKMNFENSLNKLYQKVADQIISMIPEEWEKFYFNSEVKNGEGGAFFFYETQYQKTPVYSHLIPSLFKIDKKNYNKNLHTLFNLSKELQKVFIDYEQEPWFSMTMIVTSKGNVNVTFDYIDWTETNFGPSNRIDFFMYKYFEMEPENDQDKEVVKKMEIYEELNL